MHKAIATKDIKWSFLKAYEMPLLRRKKLLTMSNKLVSWFLGICVVSYESFSKPQYTFHQIVMSSILDDLKYW